jgi:HAD superfamily hydrolase (TIGR01490 family)
VGNPKYYLMISKTKKKRKVAIFDIDGTIFRSSLFLELTDALIEEGIFPAQITGLYDTKYRCWLDRRGSYDDYIMAVVHAYLKHIKGVAYKDFARVADGVVALRKDRVYRYTRDLVKDLRRRGYYLLAISQSPRTILDGFCKNLGFHKVYGRIYETGPEGKFTGEIGDLHLIANKANIVRRAVERENLTLKESVGVGDTEDDIPFLELVEKPICFNPTKELYRHARRNKWKVVVERKNVIYEL